MKYFKLLINCFFLKTVLKAINLTCLKSTYNLFQYILLLYIFIIPCRNKLICYMELLWICFAIFLTPKAESLSWEMINHSSVHQRQYMWPSVLCSDVLHTLRNTGLLGHCSVINRPDKYHEYYTIKRDVVWYLYVFKRHE